MPHRYALPVYVVVVLLIGGFAQWLSQRLDASRQTHAASAGVVSPTTGNTTDGSLKGRSIPAFSLQDQEKRTVSRDELLGHVWVADFIFVQCGETCPVLNRHMVELERAKELDDVRFVSFSVDPSDTPSALKRYIETGYEQADANRWRILAADVEQFPKFSVGLGLAASEKEVRDGFLAISPDLYLVDTGGKVVGEYDGTDDAAVARLRGDAASLVKSGKLVAMSPADNR